MREGWNSYKIEELGRIVTGKTPSTQNSDNFGDKYPFVTPRDMSGQKKIEKTERYLSEQGKDSVKNCLLPTNSICVSCIGSDMGKVVMTTKDSIINQQLNSIICDDLFDPDFVYYSLVNISAELKNAGHHSTAVPILNKTDFSNFEIIAPDLPTQRRIAAVLSALDDKIELNRQTNQTLEAVAQALFKEWFVDFNFPGATGEMQESELGPIPVGWSVAPFANTIEIYGGGTPKTSIADYWDGEIPWFSVVDAPRESDVWVLNTEKTISISGVENSSTRLLPQGTTIISARGTVGRIALTGVTMAMNQYCYGLYGKYDDLGFFTYYSTSALVKELQQKTHGSVFDTITRDTLHDVLVTLPPPNIIQLFENMVKPELFCIKENILESQTLAILRDLLLPELMGEKVKL